ncbi:MAG: hypothetical protein KatS3mg054_0023 [Chloroflexus sp.]|nr:MAG: hypothetical protein KatS3mg054_0023 [Chloroflexus sp.]
MKSTWFSFELRPIDDSTPIDKYLRNFIATRKPVDAPTIARPYTMASMGERLIRYNERLLWDMVYGDSFSFTPGVKTVRLRLLPILSATTAAVRIIPKDHIQPAAPCVSVQQDEVSVNFAHVHLHIDPVDWIPQKDTITIVITDSVADIHISPQNQTPSKKIVILGRNSRLKLDSGFDVSLLAHDCEVFFSCDTFKMNCNLMLTNSKLKCIHTKCLSLINDNLDRIHLSNSVIFTHIPFRNERPSIDNIMRKYYGVYNQYSAYMYFYDTAHMSMEYPLHMAGNHLN